MKRILIATGLALGSLAALAQAPAPAAPEIPPFNCEPKPVYPGIDKIKTRRTSTISRPWSRSTRTA